MVNLRELKIKKREQRKKKILEEIEEENEARAIRDAREDYDDTDKREERKEEKKLVYVEESSSEDESVFDNEVENSDVRVQNQTREMGSDRLEYKKQMSEVSAIDTSANVNQAILEQLDTGNIREATTSGEIGGLLLHPDIFSLTFYGLMKDDHDQEVIKNFRQRSASEANVTEISGSKMERVVNLLRMQRNSKNLHNAAVLFVIQSILLVVSFYTNSSDIVETRYNSYSLLLSQAICSLLLHLSLYQKLHRSVEKIIYIKEYPARFHPHF